MGRAAGYQRLDADDSDDERAGGAVAATAAATTGGAHHHHQHHDKHDKHDKDAPAAAVAVSVVVSSGGDGGDDDGGKGGKGGKTAKPSKRDRFVPKPGPDGQLEDYDTYTARFRSIYVMVLTSFIGSIMFSITLPSMALFLNRVASGAYRNETYIDAASSSCDGDSDDSFDTSFLGFVVAAYSAGQFFSSPLTGYLYNVFGARLPTTTSLLILIAGNLLYSLARSEWFILIARVIVGIGASNASVARAFCAKATTLEETTIVMGWLAASQAIGFIVGPVFGLFLSSVNVLVTTVGSGDSLWYYRLDKYTSPGYLSALFGVLNMFFFLTFFRDYRSQLDRIDEKKATKTEKKPLLSDQDGDDDDEDSSDAQHRRHANTVSSSADPAKSLEAQDSASKTIDDPDKIRIVTFKGTKTKYLDLPALYHPYNKIGVITLILASFVLTTAFSAFEAIGTPFACVNFGWDVIPNSLFFAGSGFISVLAFFVVRFFGMGKLDDRIMLTLALASMGMGLGGVMIPFTPPPVHPAQYVTIFYSFFSVGYPISQIMTFSMYSKVLGPGSHGTMMGIQTAAGAAARIVGPLWATRLFDLDYDPNADFHMGLWVWISLSSIMALSALCTLAVWKHLVPHPYFKELREYQRKRAERAAQAMQKTAPPTDETPLLGSPAESISDEDEEAAAAAAASDATDANGDDVHVVSDAQSH